MAAKLGIMVCVGLVCVGCAVRLATREAVPAGTFAVRIAANLHDHKDVIELARSTTDDKVVENGRVVAEWLPLWSGGPAEKGLSESKDIVSREKAHGHEVLVVHGPSDITEQDTGRASYIADSHGRHDVSISLTEKGSESISSLTRSHLPDDKTGFHRQAAMIVKSRVYSLPQIEHVVYTRVVIRPVSEHDAEQLVDILNGVSPPGKVDAKRVGGSTEE
jgi:hypothetical protein